MREFYTEELDSGTVFPSRLRTEEGLILAEPFTRLDQAQLDQLSAWNIRTICSESEPLSTQKKQEYIDKAVGDSSLEQVIEESEEAEETYSFHKNRRPARTVNEGLKKQVRDGYEQSLDHTMSLLRPISKGTVNDTRRLYQALQPLYESLWHLPRTVLFLLSDHTLDSDEEYIYTYSLNTALYSFLIARELKLEPDIARAVGVCGLVHDLGMFKIPQNIRHKEDEYSKDERQVMMTHPDKGARMLLRFENLEKSIARAVREHHEQYDGEGYPRQLKGEEIHLYARIVHLAMTFAAMTQPRFHRDARGSIESIQQILTEESEQFDPDVLDAFLSMIGLYPVGTMVELETGCEAMVVGSNLDEPESPEVKVFTNREGQFLDQPYLIDLADDPDHITQVLNKKQREYSALALA